MSKKTTKAQAVDARLFQQIQPHGGITFADPSYTRMGDGYCRCLHIYGLALADEDLHRQRLHLFLRCGHGGHGRREAQHQPLHR